MKQKIADLVLEGYQVEIRYLNYDKSKDPCFSVKIKKYDEELRKVDLVAAGYNGQDIEVALDYAIKKMNEGSQYRDPRKTIYK